MLQQFPFDPPGYCLSNLRLFPDVLVVAVHNHCCIYSARTTNKALNRRLQQREFFLAADIAFEPKKARAGHATRAIAGLGVLVPKKSLYSRGVVTMSRCVAALMKEGKERCGSRSRSSPAPSATSFFACASNCGSSAWAE